MPGTHLVLRVVHLSRVGGLHLFVGHLARLHLEAQHLRHEGLPAHGVASRIPGDALLCESLTEVGHVHVLLPRELFEGALQLLLGNGQPKSRRLRLDQLLVDQLGKSTAQQVRAVLLPLRSRWLGHQPHQLGPDALLHVGEEDRLSVHDRGDAFLQLGARGRGAKEQGKNEAFHRTQSNAATQRRIH